MKQRIRMTVDGDNYQRLKAANVNISGLVNTSMQNEVRRQRTERRQAEDSEGMSEITRSDCIRMNKKKSWNITMPMMIAVRELLIFLSVYVLLGYLFG